MLDGIGRWLSKFQDVTLAFVFFAASFGVGFVAVLTHHRGATAVLLALASAIVGSVIGFLFGIPRVLQGGSGVEAGTAKNSAEAGGSTSAGLPYRLQVNTNLEQISDWLTKIIVGIGLVELKQIPSVLERASTFMARGLGGVADREAVFASVVIVYFSVVSFLGGYVLTRIYLTGAFKRADESTVMNVGGTDLTNEEVSVQMRAAVSDLRTQILQRQARQPIQGAPDREAVTVSEAVTTHSVLWVDDHPKSNGLIIEYLKSLGIDVVTVESTKQAFALLGRRKFDRLISDMGRAGDEGGARAGVELIKKIRAGGAPAYRDIPIVVYCSAAAAQQYGQEAVTAGAERVTPSQSELLEALHLYG